MKVVGTGAPRTLTIRLQPCEFDAWRRELRRRLSAVATYEGSSDLSAASAARGEDDELAALSRLLEQALMPVPTGQPRVIIGPTWLLRHVVRAVAVDAMDSYVASGRAYSEGSAASTADQLRAALDTATACTATLIGLSRAEVDADPERRRA